MIPPEVIAAFTGVQPVGGDWISAARDEDRERVDRMLAAPVSDWSDDDINIVMFRVQTTLGGPETFKWVLPAWLDRSSSYFDQGWMTISETLADKLDRAGFDGWPEAQRVAILPMLADWLRAQETAFPDDYVPYEPADGAVFRNWLKARL